MVEEKPEDAPRAVLKGFLDAVGAGNWARAWSLLSDPLRARYTPERLREDFKREPLSAERVRRARLALEGDVRVTASGAEFPMGKGRAVRLVPGSRRVPGRRHRMRRDAARGAED